MIFRTQYGQFKYQVISFGLTNAPIMFQSYINKILMDKFNVFVIMYFNDILIYTKSEKEEYLEAIWWVLN